MGIYILTNILPVPVTIVKAQNNKIVYPIKEMSKLECRYEKFSDLGSNCKQNLPILKTKDYKKYAKENGGYNDYTRIYTVLWGASYKYGWDVGNGGHMGVDIATAEGTPVYAMSDGEVIISKTTLGFGKAVSIKHKIDGKYIYSNYGHLSKINVSKGDKVSAGEKIGEVGTTGNSTGNHLHFQIDLDTPFHPYYYDYQACPYSYYEITESSICFDELKNNTIDPLLFLETNGAILDDIDIKIEKIDISKNKSDKIVTNNSNTFDYSIFNTTVYVGYPSSDVKKVQEIFTDLGEYNGPISGDYKDIEDYIVAYQISNNIIKNKNSEGAGWFGPKTRAQAKNDYINYLNSGGEPGDGIKNNNKKLVVNNKIKVETISKDGLLSREEIEKRDIESFFSKYNFEFYSKSIGANVKLGETKTYTLKITDKKGKEFKGNMPTGVTFVADFSKIKVFPEKLYYFTNGERDIEVTGLKTGDTTIYAKVGTKVLKSFPLKVYDGESIEEPEKGAMIINKNVVLGDTQRGIAVFKDKLGKNLINIDYKGEFKLTTSDDVKVCIKYGDLKDIKSIYSKSCEDSWFKDEISFNYGNTVGGIVLFEYKVTGKDAKIELVNNTKNSSMVSKTFSVSNPKGMKSNYAYKSEVIDMLSMGIVDGINKGYFLEERELSKQDAINRIKNTLEVAKNETIDNYSKKKIEANIKELSNSNAGKYDYISRQQFLDLAYKYLVFNNDYSISISYKDLDEDSNQKANMIFDKENTWKDKFGENYFRPDINLTRGEAAYFLATLIDKNKQKFLTSK